MILGSGFDHWSISLLQRALWVPQIPHRYSAPRLPDSWLEKGGRMFPHSSVSCQSGRDLSPTVWAEVRDTACRLNNDPIPVVAAPVVTPRTEERRFGGDIV